MEGASCDDGHEEWASKGGTRVLPSGRDPGHRRSWTKREISDRRPSWSRVMEETLRQPRAYLDWEMFQYIERVDFFHRLSSIDNDI